MTTDAAAIDDLLRVFRHERGGDEWVGCAPDSWGPIVFGGTSLALTISAACGDAPVGTRTSLHAHLLRS